MSLFFSKHNDNLPQDKVRGINFMWHALVIIICLVYQQRTKNTQNRSNSSNYLKWPQSNAQLTKFLVFL